MLLVPGPDNSNSVHASFPFKILTRSGQALTRKHESSTIQIHLSRDSDPIIARRLLCLGVGQSQAMLAPGTVTVRCTPAMEAGLTDHVWSIAEMVGLLSQQVVFSLHVAGEPESMTATVRREMGRSSCLIGTHAK
jgi:hypothetical protein